MPQTSIALSDRLLRAAARSLGGSPRWVKRALAGPPVHIDGQQLDIEAQMGVRALRIGVSKTFEELPVAEGREQIRGEAYVFGGVTSVEAVRELTLEGPSGSIPARLYRPADSPEAGAALVYLHGGGWVLGDLGSADAVCRFLAAHTPITVISVDYRLAPENPFPAGLDDCLAAYNWVIDHAAELGIDPQKVAIGGESAGGNLAAVVALTVDDFRPPPALQVLFNPVTDLSTRRRSYKLFGEGFFLTEKQMDWYQNHYLRDPSQVHDPRVSPLLADDVSHAPPAYVVVAGFDVLRDEGEAYAQKLAAAGVDVTLRRHTGLIHGLINATGVGIAARNALLETVGVLHTRLVKIDQPAESIADGKKVSS